MDAPSRPPIARGRTAEVYDWGRGHVLKLYHAWCPADWAEHEVRIARLIVAAGIPAPAVDGVVEVNGRQGIIYERVTGRSMLDELRRQPWRLLHYARSLAELQVQFHRLTVADLPTYRHSLAHSIRRAPHLPAALRETALNLLATLPDGQALCHGDFHPGNVLISSHGPVVIDWTTARLGSPWADVARSSMLLTVGVKGAGRQASPVVRLLSGWFHRAYLSRYRSLVPDGQAELARWLPVIAAARLDERIEPERTALLQTVETGARRFG